MTVIFIRGSDTQLGQRLVQACASHPHVRLVVMEQNLPPTSSGEHMAELMRQEQVDVVINLASAGEEAPAQNRDQAFQANVLHSSDLLGACARAGVKRIVLRSSTLVYGSHLKHAAFLDEETRFARSARSPLISDYVEQEQIAAEFARTHPDQAVIILRCASLVAPDWPSPLVRYFAQPRPCMLFGFNPRIQVLHPDDAVAAYLLAAEADVSGAFNLAANDPLTLLQAIRLAGRQPQMFLEPVVMLARRVIPREQVLGYWPFAMDLLRYSCVADIRKAQAQLNWQPAYAARAIVEELNTAPAVIQRSRV
ncbi:MAG: NAD-dependent epimerase/dehydratase family protein [Chloroflexaceae bacterium]|nr:NAD-dependent epimerase/dehydratase family protein [Chloroflexaceae bacterium]